MLVLQLPPELQKRLEALARRTGRSESSYAQEAIVDYLDDLDDVAIAEQRVEALRNSESETMSLAELMKRHGVDG